MMSEREQQDSSQQSTSVLENCILILNSLYLFIYLGFCVYFRGKKVQKESLVNQENKVIR